MGDIKTLKVVDFGEFETTPANLVDKAIRKHLLPRANIHSMRFIRDSAGKDHFYCEFESHETASAIKHFFETKKQSEPSSILFEWSYINLEEYMAIQLKENIEISYKEPQADQKNSVTASGPPDIGSWFCQFLPWQD